MMTDTPCRPVSLYRCGMHSENVAHREDVEDFAADPQYGGNTIALCAVGTAGERPPPLQFAIAEDRSSAWLVWEGEVAAGIPPAVADAPLVVDDTDRTTRTIPADQLTVTPDDVRAALLEWLDTGQRPTCVEWPTSSP